MRGFSEPTTIRIKPDIRDRVRAVANREGNTEAAVLRRVIAAGLGLVDPHVSRDATGSRSPNEAA